jgi:hypothetical protein
MRNAHKMLLGNIFESGFFEDPEGDGGRLITSKLILRKQIVGGGGGVNSKKLAQVRFQWRVLFIDDFGP